MSCYMALGEQQKCHVTWIWEKNKSVMLHEFGKKTKVSCYMSLVKKQVSCYIALGEKQKCHLT